MTIKSSGKIIGLESHGHASNGRNSKTYRAWDRMKQRCNNSRSASYPYYGGRGITVCERWKNSFKAFLADLGPAPEGLTLERRDNDGNYEPGNCKWATWEEQDKNRRGGGRLSYQAKETMLLRLTVDALL